MMTALKRTRYATDTDGMICLLLDIRGQARPNSLQVFSYSQGKVVNLPRRQRDGRDLIRIETPEAKRWAAVSVPRWLANREGLHGKPDLQPVMSGFCRQFTPDTRTAQERIDDGERSLAEYVVSRENKYRRTPDQRAGFSKRDYISGRAFQ